MLIKTRGIVLNYLKYRDTSIIVKVYTEKLGLRSYIINGIRSSRSRSKIALFQPLTLLDLVVYTKNTDLNRIKEYRVCEPVVSIPFDVRKSSIAIFLAELLAKSIREEEENPALFDFIFQSILILDHMQQGFMNFHLQFILKLSRFLGFAVEKADNLRMDLQFPGDLDVVINELIASRYENEIRITKEQRLEVLDVLQTFFRHHFHIQGDFKSIKVLREVMN